MPEIVVQYDGADASATITASDDLTQSVWNRISQTLSQFDTEARFLERSVKLSWAGALTALMEIAAVRSSLGLSIRAVGEAEDRLIRFRAERLAVAAARGNRSILLTLDEITDRLRHRGFTRRELREFQSRDLQRMLAIQNGANFSVPGAGKTTVALALHLLAVPVDTRLLVICPKNAFEAWDTVIPDCIDSSTHPEDAQRFVRLDGPTLEIQRSLESGRRRFLMSYDRLIRTREVISAWIARVPTHLILDESHRIKAGDYSQRGRALLALAPVPVRRDILSGTPAPNSLEDLAPQLEFLWPGMGLGRQIVDSGRPAETLHNLYVRTTKGQLGLPPVQRRFIHVEMSSPQLALYGLLKSEAVRQLSRLRTGANVDIIRARRSVLRLLQASVDPVAAALAIGAEGFESNSQTEAILQGVVESGDSPKFLTANRMAREIASSGRKVVMWTIFRRSIDRLATLLADLDPIVLHGDVPTGDEADERTREGRIRKFHADPRCRVAIANPAACSEGISLHTVCHEAIYVDRSYNAAHYLQSLDRIHRLGLPAGVQTNVHILQSVAPERLGSIDHSVSRRLLVKMQVMDSILNDEDIRQLALDEEEAEPPVDRDISLDDLADLLEQLMTSAIPEEDEQE